MKTGIYGTGAMGSGIALVAGLAGNEVCLFDPYPASLDKAQAYILDQLNKSLAKGKISPEQHAETWGRFYFGSDLSVFKSCDLVIEAIVEDLNVKQDAFRNLENIVSDTCILATNTSSLSVTSLAACLKLPQRFVGIHFFNPAAIMPLVEIIGALQTQTSIIDQCVSLMHTWGKVPVIAKDTPGFIVNKVARPFYSEALRLLDEGISDIFTIDGAMRDMGFRMGPFELMDFIGHDVNYVVTETVWKSFYFDARYRPSLSQKKLVEAGYFGKKSGRGFYDYAVAKEETQSDYNKKELMYETIGLRILSMLINEAADTIYLGICNENDIELAMTKGVNYPKGLLAWGEEIGWSTVVSTLDHLHEYYREERYRVSPWLRRKIR